MNLLFHLGHPAHFHLFKNVVKHLKQRNHKITLAIKKKDVLEDLIVDTGLNFVNLLPEGRKDTLMNIFGGLIKQDIRLFSLCKKLAPDLLIGTSVACAHVGKMLKIPSINFNEDDAKQVPYYSYLSYPFASSILTPIVCNNGRWNNISIKYNGYHELAYLTPNYFIPDYKIVKKYISEKRPFFIIRFAKLTAHHDKNRKGISKDIALKIISLLKNKGQIIINSEKDIDTKLNQYIVDIDPKDIHHMLAFAEMFIGDSQTMTAEAAVLGTPSIRFNDFVGKLGYLEELEHKYGLTYGIKTTEPEKLLHKIEELLFQQQIKNDWGEKRQRMLDEKIDVTAFMLWFIENYPTSHKMIKENPDLLKTFK